MESPRSGQVRAESFQDVLLSRVQALRCEQMHNMHQLRRYTDLDTFNKIVHQEIERLETSCGSLFSFVELASAHMHAVRHVQQDSGDAEGADAAAPSSCSHDAPPPVVRRTKRKSYILAESLARTANERAQSAFNQHLQATSLHDMD